MTRSFALTTTLSLSALLASMSACNREDPAETSRDDLVDTTPQLEEDPEFGDPEPQNAKPRPGVRDAEVELKGVGDEEISGEVEFSETGRGVRIVAAVKGASPGLHGIHVHDKGDCSDVPGGSTGGHYKPEDYPHALPGETNNRHLGDLGNIEINPEGEGRLTITIGDARLNPGDPNSFSGRSLVLHQGEDLGKSHQPAGDSGPAVACGVIKLD